MSALLHPRVLPPVGRGDRGVWVSGVTSGSILSVRMGDQVLGELHAVDPVVRVPVDAVKGPVHAVVRRGDLNAASDEVEARLDPGATPEDPEIVEAQLDFGPFAVPPHRTDDGDEGGFDVDLRVRAYLPSDHMVIEHDDARPAHGLPLVLIAHGMWQYPQVDTGSLEGYAWLAHHLARWGMAVCSVDLSQVNRETMPLAQQSARGEVILAALDHVLQFERLAGIVDRDRIGLVGHSMGGEAVVVAQALNRRRAHPLGIRGIASLAPTNYRTDLASTHAAYIQLHGSLDYLLGWPPLVTGDSPRFGGFRLYERAWRPRTHAFIDGAGHDAWNSVWLESGTGADPIEPPEPWISPARQREAGRALLTAFFVDALSGQEPYRGYLAGPNRPQALDGLTVHVQHQVPSVVVVDDFGDGADQLGLDTEESRDQTVNRRGGDVAASGAGLRHWDEVDHVDLPRSMHGTYGVDLAWSDDDVVYRTGLDGVAARGVDDVVSLQMAQHYAENDDGEPDETWNPASVDLDLTVELDDGSEHAGVRLGIISFVAYPLPGGGPYSAYQTVRLPLDAFTAVNPQLDLNGLEQLRLRMNRRATGRLLVDDIEVATATLVTTPARVVFLRAHELGTGYGPPDDHLDGEVVARLEDCDDAFGFALRPGPRLPAARRMLDALRAALAADRPVQLTYVLAGPRARQLIAVEHIRHT
jgi:acetyl esterase/lipase